MGAWIVMLKERTKPAVIAKKALFDQNTDCVLTREGTF